MRVSVFLKHPAHKEKTASGQSRSDLMKNKRNKIVSKRQNAHGKKAMTEVKLKIRSQSTRRIMLNLFSKLRLQEVRQNDHHSVEPPEATNGRIAEGRMRCWSLSNHIVS